MNWPYVGVVSSHDISSRTSLCEVEQLITSRPSTATQSFSLFDCAPNPFTLTTRQLSDDASGKAEQWNSPWKFTR